MRSSLKKGSASWENTINVEDTSDSIKIKCSAMDSHSPCLRTGFTAVTWADAEHRDKRCQMVHNWLHKGLSTDFQIVRPAGKSRHRHHLESTGIKSLQSCNSPKQNKPTEKYHRAGKIWS